MGFMKRSMQVPTLPSVIDCQVHSVQNFREKDRGNLFIVENCEIQRVFWIEGVPKTAKRGEHALRFTTQHFVAIQGAASLTLEDGKGESETIRLDHPVLMVTVPPMVFRTLSNFTEDAVIMAVCDRKFDINEYVERLEWEQLVLEKETSRLPV